MLLSTILLSLPLCVIAIPPPHQGYPVEHAHKGGIIARAADWMPLTPWQYGFGSHKKQGTEGKAQ
ncbi:hypothetical protein E4U14_003615 [Claviceps sp. LM454 group G7]|nr:hypothetical protein E4U14_003615 [Claviceps sp. LM454 group G7]